MRPASRPGRLRVASAERSAPFHSVAARSSRRPMTPWTSSIVVRSVRATWASTFAAAAGIPAHPRTRTARVTASRLEVSVPRTSP